MFIKHAVYDLYKSTPHTRIPKHIPEHVNLSNCNGSSLVASTLLFSFSISDIAFLRPSHQKRENSFRLNLFVANFEFKF